MKKWILAAAILGTVSLQTAGATTLNFSSWVNASISFDGVGDFSFPNGNGGQDFLVTGTVGGTDATTAGLFGNLSGTFALGPISTSGGVETAAVTGTGLLAIHDASSVDFTATLNWISMTTSGSSGTINQLAQVNLSNLTYTGTNTDLLALKAAGTGTGTVTFTFTDTSHDLNYLATHATVDAYQGAISAVPEPMTFSLMGAGLLGLGLLRKRVSK